MSNTYYYLVHHLVWSTKKRALLILPSIAPHLYNYIGGIVRQKKGVLLACGGMPDHIHLLVSLNPSIAISNLMCSIKTYSAKFVQRQLEETLVWQNGYGAFVVSGAQINTIKNYIANQETHHKNYSFEHEFIALLNKHNIEYNKQNLFV